MFVFSERTGRTDRRGEKVWDVLLGHSGATGEVVKGTVQTLWGILESVEGR